MHTAPIIRASVDAEGRWVVTASQDKTVRIWSTATGELLRTIRLPAGPGNVGRAYAVAIHPDGALIAVGGQTRAIHGDPREQIYFFDRNSGSMVGRIEDLPGSVLHLTFSPTGDRLAATLGLGGLRIFSRESGWDETARDSDYPDRSDGASFAPDGRLATTAPDGTVRLYNANLMGDVRPACTTILPGDWGAYGVAFSPDGSRLVVGFHYSSAVDLLDGRKLALLRRHDMRGIGSGNLTTVAWSVDGETMYAAGLYQVLGSDPVLAWNAAGTGRRRSLLIQHNGSRRNSATGIISLVGGDIIVATQDPWLGRLRPDGSLAWEHGSPKADYRDQRDTLGLSEDGSCVTFGFELRGAVPRAVRPYRARARD